MPVPVSFYGEKYNDNTIKSNGEPESGSWAVPVTTLTATNLAAQTTLMNNLSTAVGAILLGVLAQATTTQLRVQVSTLAAASRNAQRENKFLARYHDATTNQKFQVSFPTADLAQVINHSEFIDLTAGVGAALKTAFEAVVVSPDDSSNAVILDSVQFVGRNT